MNCELYVNKSLDNVLNKTIEKIDDIEIKFIENFNDDYLIIKNNKNFNYLKIEDSFYFVRDSEILDNKRIKVKIEKDVLMTYKNLIENMNVRVITGNRKDLKNFSLQETTKRNYNRIDFPINHFTNNGDIIFSVINTRG